MILTKAHLYPKDSRLAGKIYKDIDTDRCRVRRNEAEGYW